MSNESETATKAINVKKSGYVYIITCNQYAKQNRYHFGKTYNLKKCLESYQIDHNYQMYYAFIFKSTDIELIKESICNVLKGFKEHKKKNIYIISGPILLNFMQQVCNNFYDKIIPARNNMIKNVKRFAGHEGIIPPMSDISIYDESDVDFGSVASTDSDDISEGNPLQCDKCAKVFDNCYKYDKHVDRIIPCDVIFQCRECGKKFNTLRKYRRHSKRSTPCR